MHPMTQHYLIAALWSSTDNTDEQGGEPLDTNYTIDDCAPETIDRAERECLALLGTYSDVIGDRLQQAGHDFWLTRNHHGAGFWDGDWPNDIGIILTNAAHAFPEVDLYVGDDSKLYFA